MGFTTDSRLTIGIDTIADLQEKITSVLDEARRQGASACEAVAAHTVVQRAGTLAQPLHETLMTATLGLAVYRGQQRGEVTIDLTSDSFSTVSAVEQALQSASSAQADAHVGLADAESMAYEYPQLNLYFETPTTGEQLLAQAQQCEKAGLERDARMTASRGTSLSVQHGGRVHGNSHGFLGSYIWTEHALNSFVRATAGDEVRTGGFQEIQRCFADLTDFAEAGRQAADRALSYLGGQSLAAGKYAAVLAPAAAQQLLAGFIQAISGTALTGEGSFLLGSLDKPVFGPGVAIVENPLLPSGLGSVPYDADGVKVQARSFVEDGRLVSYALDAQSARRLKLPNTGNASANPFEVARNLSFLPGDQDQVGLCREMDQGVLVAEARNLQLNLRTGDFTLRAIGYKVEAGVMQHVLAPFLLRGQLQELFARVVAVGRDDMAHGRISSGSVLVESVAII